MFMAAYTCRHRVALMIAVFALLNIGLVAKADRPQHPKRELHPGSVSKRRESALSTDMKALLNSLSQTGAKEANVKAKDGEKKSTTETPPALKYEETKAEGDRIQKDINTLNIDFTKTVTTATDAQKKSQEYQKDLKTLSDEHEKSMDSYNKIRDHLAETHEKHTADTRGQLAEIVKQNGGSVEVDAASCGSPTIVTNDKEALKTLVDKRLTKVEPPAGVTEDNAQPESEPTTVCFPSTMDSQEREFREKYKANPELVGIGAAEGDAIFWIGGIANSECCAKVKP